MEAARSSKMLLSYHVTTWCHNLNSSGYATTIIFNFMSV